MNRDEALNLLHGGAEGIAKWNRRRTAADEIPYLDGASLTWADLRGVNLNGVYLRRADLRLADLRMAKLSEANLRRADLSGAKLNEADLSRADLSGADLSGAYLNGADLQGANLTECDLSRANLRLASLNGADLQGANLTECDLSGANLRGAFVAGAYFYGVLLAGTYFSAADLRGVDLTDVGITGDKPTAAQPMRHDLAEGASEENDKSRGKTPRGEPSTPPVPPPSPPLQRVPRLALDNRPTQVLQALMRRIALRVRNYIQRSSRVADPVDCTVFAPRSVVRGASLIVQIFAHRPDQTEEIKGLAQELDEEARRRGFQSLEVELERGTRLNVHLHLPGIEFHTANQAIVWLGRPTYVVFISQVPLVGTIGDVIGSVTVSRDGVPLGSIIFKIKVLDRLASPQSRNSLLPAGVAARRYKRAFISYATADRSEVLKRVQMLRLARIRYFQDVLKLEPGDRVERELYLLIDKSDLFLLFWSTNAKASKWVLEEVRYALKRKGGDELAPPELIPVIIEGPPIPTPPDELAHLHFNDYLLYFMTSADLKT